MICKVFEWRASVDPYPVLNDPKDPSAGVTIKNDRGRVFAVLPWESFVEIHGLSAWKKLCAEQAATNV